MEKARNKTTIDESSMMMINFDLIKVKPMMKLNNILSVYFCLDLLFVASHSHSVSCKVPSFQLNQFGDHLYFRQFPFYCANFFIFFCCCYSKKRFPTFFSINDSIVCNWYGICVSIKCCLLLRHLCSI